MLIRKVQRKMPSSTWRLSMTRFIDSLPERFKWTIHNLIAHPMSEILYQLGMEDLGNRLHDATVPTHESGTGHG